MTAPNNRLSLAASAIWGQRENAWQDYAMDGSGDCGPLIEKAHRSFEVAALAEHGYTPESYNQALRDRLVGGDYPQMTYATYRLLGDLEVETDEEHADGEVVCTLGYPGHPGAENSTIGYLKGAF